MGRSGGFERPFHPWQLASWVYMAVVEAGFGLLLAPGLGWDGWWGPAAAAAYAGLTVAVLALAVASMRADPSDPAVIEKRRRAKACGGAADGERAAGEARGAAAPEVEWCSYCQVHTLVTSKHCRACNRCAHGFDHHCRWLNNCVGEANYGLFFALVASLDALVLLEGALCVASLVHSARDERGQGATGDDHRHRALVALLLAALLPAAVMLTQLLCLHVWLAVEGMSTYEWIVQRRDSAMGLPVRPKAGPRRRGCCARDGGGGAKVAPDPGPPPAPHVDGQEQDGHGPPAAAGQGASAGSVAVHVEPPRALALP